MHFRKFLNWYVSPLVIGSAIGIALILSLLTILLLWVTRSYQTPPTQTTAILNIIPLNIATQTASPAQPLVTPTNPSQDSDKTIAVGDHIQISGTGGDGLRLRINPGLNNQIMFIGTEGEIFMVNDGPREADGYNWWYLISIDDETVKGWGVSEYMEEIEFPEG
jgi:hypothetical protein